MIEKAISKGTLFFGFWIGVFFIFLGVVLAYKIFLRTNMRSFFLFTVGNAAIGFSFIGGVIWLIYNLDSLKQGRIVSDSWTTLILLILTLGSLINYLGFAFFFTAERGVWEEICKRTSFWQRLVAKVPVVEKTQYTPVINKRIGLIAGIPMIIAGLFVILSQYLLKFSINLTGVLLIASITYLILGPLLIAVIGLGYNREE